MARSNDTIGLVLEGIDSNILVRLVIDDDPDQTRLVYRLARVEGALFVNRLVLAECIWVLARRYGLSRVRIAQEILVLFDSSEVVFEDEDQVDDALTLSAEMNPDLPIALSNNKMGQTPTLTFDRKAAARITAFEPVG